MVRCLCFAVSVAVLVGGAGRAPAQTEVAPLYSLPADGVWVEFDFQCWDRRHKEITGTMRISSTRAQRVGDAPYRWVEIRMAGRGIETRYGKMLVAEEALRQGKPLRENVLEAYHQEGEGGPVLRFSGPRVIEYFTMGVSDRLTEVRARDEVATGLGSLTCKYVESTGRGRLRPARNGADRAAAAEVERPEASAERSLQYRAWLSDDVPFGVAKFEVWARAGKEPEHPVFVAVAARSGKGEVRHLTR